MKNAKLLKVITVLLFAVVTILLLLLLKLTNINNIKKHYGPTVVVTKTTKLYQKSPDVSKTDKYTTIGVAEPGLEWSLDPIPDINTGKINYFKVTGEDFYLYYKDIKPIPQKTQTEIPASTTTYPKTVQTKTQTKLYQNQKLMFEIAKEYQFPVITENETDYTVVYANQLFQILKTEVEEKIQYPDDDATIGEIYGINPQDLPPITDNATTIPVINYHFFYDAAKGESCDEGNCLELTNFKEQLEFLRVAHYKTLTMEEYRAWMYGEIELPARSILITVDDGAMGTGKHNGNHLIPILEEYKMYATLFLISGWWDISNYESKYLNIESHTYDMHTGNICGNQPRGAQLLCSSKDQVLADLHKSIEIDGSNKAFCFPFYAYNDEALQTVQEAGFQLAFVGGYEKSSRADNKYTIPRYPVRKDTDLSDFIRMVL